MFKPTMIYLEPEQLEKLREQARRQRISMAELVRRIVAEHTERGPKPPSVTRRTYMTIVAMGSSGRKDVSEKHDQYLGEALRLEHSR